MIIVITLAPDTTARARGQPRRMRLGSRRLGKDRLGSRRLGKDRLGSR